MKSRNCCGDDARSRSAGFVMAAAVHCGLLAALVLGLNNPPRDLRRISDQARAIHLQLRTRQGSEPSTSSAPAISASPRRPPPSSRPAWETAVAALEGGATQMPSAEPGPTTSRSALSSRPLPSIGAEGVAQTSHTAESLTRALRGVVGCSDANNAGLSPEEKETCRDRLLAMGKDASELPPLIGMDPQKRAAFAAAWKADHSPQHMAVLGCFARFGGGKVQWLKPSEGAKIGRLPCYYATPKATFAPEKPDRAN
jgi:hypothetical protein